MYIWNSQRRSVSGCFYSIISVQCVRCLRYYCYCIISFSIHWDAVRNPGFRNQAFEELHLIKVVMQQDYKCESFFNHNIKTIFLLIFEGFSNVFPHVHAIFSLLFGKHVQNVYERRMKKKHRNEGCSRSSFSVHISEIISTNRWYLVSFFWKLNVRRANINAGNHCISKR